MDNKQPCEIINTMKKNKAENKNSVFLYKLVSEVLHDKGIYRLRYEGTIAAKLVDIWRRISLETGTGLECLEKIKESSVPRAQ